MFIWGKNKSVVKDIRNVKSKQENLKVLLGTVLTKLKANSKRLPELVFKVSNDEVVRYLIRKVSRYDKFIEFGVENYEEFYSKFLFINNNWQGLVTDGIEKNINYIRGDSIYCRYGLIDIAADNINTVFKQNNFSGNIGLLHIDIDGNDYQVLKAITDVDPETVPYKHDFTRSSGRYSYLYVGCISTCSMFVS